MLFSNAIFFTQNVLKAFEAIFIDHKAINLSSMGSVLTWLRIGTDPFFNSWWLSSLSLISLSLSLSLYIYIYMYMCVCMCVCASLGRNVFIKDPRPKLSNWNICTSKPFRMIFFSVIYIIIHQNVNIAISMKCLSLAASRVFKIATFDAASDEDLPIWRYFVSVNGDISKPYYFQ